LPIAIIGIAAIGLNFLFDSSEKPKENNQNQTTNDKQIAVDTPNAS